MQEDRRLMTQKISQLQNDHENIKQAHDAKTDEYELLEKEYRKLQDKHRETLNNEYKVANMREQAELALKVKHDEAQKVTNDYSDEIRVWKNERAQMQTSIHQLMAENEKLRMDLNKQVGGYKQKY